jgi:RHS repeat-associated protein
VEQPNGDRVSYEYDADGIRVSATVNGETTDFLVDKNRAYAQVLEEFKSDDSVTLYVYGHDLITQVRDGESLFYEVDGLGSTRGLTDDNGELVDEYQYEAFGGLIGSSGTSENNYLFAGEQFDEGVEQYYLRDRFYDQGAGRFTRRDVFQGRKMSQLPCINIFILMRIQSI